MSGGTIIAAVVALLIGLVLGGVAIYIALRLLGQSKIRAAEEQSRQTILEAESRAREIELEARDERLRLRDEHEREYSRRQKELERQEERLRQRQEGIDRRIDQIEQRERKLNQRQSAQDKRANELEKLAEERRQELLRISNLSVDEARQILLEEVAEETRQDLARVIREVEAEMKEEADRKARELITLSIERLASEHIAETTVTSVALPGDEMKGRIIGRQGRNIRAFEAVSGVDLIVDDTPEAVVVSSFDPVRREVARIALSKLVKDGRIHPARIEREVEKAREEVEQVIKEAGEEAVFRTGLQGLHRELQRLVGQLKFRTSYGQNQHGHAIETAHLAGILAAELGINVKAAKMGGLLHDIGKAVTHETEGPHALVGAEIARKYNVPEIVLNCIASHHGEVEPQSMEATIVATADAISGARPGARRESLETYIKRVTALEEIANSFTGVQQSYAIQAGREVRIVVKPDEIDDMSAIELSREIAKKVEGNLDYPGQIKITVIRETRSVEYAK